MQSKHHMAILSALDIVASFIGVENVFDVIKYLDVIAYVNDVVWRHEICQKKLLFQTRIKAKPMLEMSFLFNMKALNYVHTRFNIWKIRWLNYSATGLTGKNS